MDQYSNISDLSMTIGWYGHEKMRHKLFHEGKKYLDGKKYSLYIRSATQKIVIIYATHLNIIKILIF